MTDSTPASVPSDNADKAPVTAAGRCECCDMALGTADHLAEADRQACGPCYRAEAAWVERETGVNPLAVGCAGDD